MRPVPLLLTAIFLLSTLSPAAAEFGHETNGFPVNVDGEVVYPYIPADLAERHPDVTRTLIAQAEPLNKVAGVTLFPYYPLLTAEMQRLAAEHPDLAQLHSAGKSHLGLDLWYLEIANFNDPSHIPLSEREVIYLDGGTHSNEYSGVYFVTEWAQFLLDEYGQDEIATWIVDNRHTFILPMVNPDGSNAFGRLNALVVNVNRNFPGTWGTVEETPVVNNPGLYPASEPETQAVIGVMDAIAPDFVQSTHCCGNLWLHPYGAEHLGNAPDFDMFTRICHNVFPDLTIDVAQIQCGETWSTIYPASGTTLDEGYARAGAASWSYEMSGRSSIPHATWGYPVVMDDVRIQETESWRGVMHGMLNAEQYGALPTITSLTLNGGNMEVVVQNQGWGNVTTAQVTVGGQAVALPPLVPGQQVTLRLDASAGDAVPVTMEWKKRIHPDSNWGRQVFNVPLVEDAGVMEGQVPLRAAPPSMGALLPDPTAYGVAAEDAQPLEHGDERGNKDSSAAGVLAIVGLLGAALWARRP